MSEEKGVYETPQRVESLLKMRVPFVANQINKLPKGTKAQNECPANEKVNCKLCGGWHHPKIIHLDYVGHASLTDRLLDADPLWTWEPFALKEGLPAFDATGGLWIRLTVCGHTRIGYGHAAASSVKEIGSREKEVIGDALRNAAMRFGAALDLWHKGDLHIDEGCEDKEPKGAVSEVKPTDDVPDFKPPWPEEDKKNLSPKTTHVKGVEEKPGEKNGKAYVLFAITDKDGERYKTFDKSFAEIARTAQESGEAVAIHFQEGKFGKSVVAIAIEEAQHES
ncbi:MAG TPA: hypothetical protein ACFYD4_08160 [Candidatus Wunengus sp. YC61]|uniref:hypothetical protein n=1 Tax=Candidatus Wunengus sp. YC61 TaxID=3367698 RepID=UPI0040276F4D